MKILWLCNKAPSIISRIQGKAADFFGGWLDSMCEQIIADKENTLYILYPGNADDTGKADNLLFSGFENKNSSRCFEKVLESFSPDVIHIWGTEFRHTYDMVCLCEQKQIINKCVVSIQGLVSVYGKYHFLDGLPFGVVFRYTLYDLLKRKNIYKKRSDYIKRGKFEQEAIKRVKHIIGRTDWDRANTQIMNPQAEYHFCNESLRDVFYSSRWSLDKAERHSIFVSQCNYPVKGFHYLLEAMPFILQKYPDTKIYTTGKDLLNLKPADKLRTSSYQAYLIKLIKKYKLSEHVVFLGKLSAEQMAERYCKANVFVSPSTIENSPNSVGEAMLTGCPVVASDVGGVKDMLEHGKEGYIYQSTAPYMLAYYVMQIFKDGEKALKMSEQAQKHAAVTHNRDENFNTLMNIYQIVGD